MMRMQSQLVREKNARHDAGIYSLFDPEGIEEIEIDPSSFPLGTYGHVPPTLPRGTVVSNF